MTWPKSWPHPALIAVVLVWGVNFPMVKVTYEGFHPQGATLLRYFFTLPFMFAVTWALTRDIHMPKEHWWRVLLGGMLGNGFYMILFLGGLERTSASQGAIALATAPIWVSLLSALFGHERISPMQYVGSALAFIGVSVAEFGSRGLGDGHISGTLMCLGSALVWGFSVIIMRPTLNQVDAMKVFSWSLFGAAPVVIWFGWHDLTTMDWAALTPRAWIGMAYMSIFSGVIGFTLYYRTIQLVGAAQTSMVSYVIPIIAAFASWPILGKPPHPSHLVGLAIVLTGLLLVSRHTKKNAPAVPNPESDNSEKMNL